MLLLGCCGCCFTFNKECSTHKRSAMLALLGLLLAGAEPSSHDLLTGKVNQLSTVTTLELSPPTSSTTMRTTPTTPCTTYEVQLTCMDHHATHNQLSVPELTSPLHAAQCEEVHPRYPNWIEKNNHVSEATCTSDDHHADLSEMLRTDTDNATLLVRAVSQPETAPASHPLRGSSCATSRRNTSTSCGNHHHRPSRAAAAATTSASHTSLRGEAASRNVAASAHLAPPSSTLPSCTSNRDRLVARHHHQLRQPGTGQDLPARASHHDLPVRPRHAGSGQHRDQREHHLRLPSVADSPVRRIHLDSRRDSFCVDRSTPRHRLHLHHHPPGRLVRALGEHGNLRCEMRPAPPSDTHPGTARHIRWHRTFSRQHRPGLAIRRSCRGTEPLGLEPQMHRLQHPHLLDVLRVCTAHVRAPDVRTRVFYTTARIAARAPLILLAEITAFVAKLTAISPLAAYLATRRLLHSTWLMAVHTYRWLVLIHRHGTSVADDTADVLRASRRGNERRGVNV